MTKKCLGCGSTLQDKDMEKEGYTINIEKDYCRRCFKLKNYGEYEFTAKTNKEYIDIFCEQLENLNEKVVIERITGDPLKEELIAPAWLLKKFCVLNDIDKEMKKRDIYQGDKVNHSW